MDQQRIILEYSPIYIVLCLLIAGGFAFLLYRERSPWPKHWTRILFAIRFLLIFLISFLLLGPIVKQIRNYYEKPLYVILQDNSASLKETIDSARLRTYYNQLDELKEQLADKGYEVAISDLSGKPVEQVSFNKDDSDLHGALKRIVQDYEGKNVSGVIFPTDGIYTQGLSPLYGQFNFPVYSIGLGDTTERTDIAVKNVAYNRIAYQGNKFPVRVEVQVKNLKNENIEVKLSQKGKLIETQSKKAGNDLLVFDFLPLASEQGIQKLDIHVTEKPAEKNIRNNRASIFVEVVEGKKKILLVAASPHPDIKPLREVIEQNSNYEFLLHIPGVMEDALKQTRPDQIDLVIFHQAPDVRGKTHALFQQFLKSKASLLFIVGQQSDLRTMAQNNLPIRFDTPPREFDQVTPVPNPSFHSFILSPETMSIFQDFPPVSVHFGRMRIPASVTPLLFQKVGSVSTEKPLLAVESQNERKVGIMLGEGLWRWRLNEYERTEKTFSFDELWGKLIQFLSTNDDKRKFKSYPLQQDFSDAEPVIFESQVYNDIFEPVYGNKIDVEVTDEAGQKKSYSYVTGPGNTRYQIGGLKEGVYRYTSRTVINNKTEEIRGQFAVIARQAELQNLTADFDLLRKLSTNTGGKFYKADQINQLSSDLNKQEVKSVIHSEESFNNLLNLKWVFWLFLLFVSVEWFARKFFGSY